MTKKSFSKSDLIDHIAEREDITQTLAKRIITSIVDVITEEVFVNGNEINIHKLGKFLRSEVAPRSRRNPQTGEPIKSSGVIRLWFKPSLSVKKKI